MTAGGRKPIEDVTVGERVMARDELSGETELRTVEHVIVRNDREVFELTFADGEQREVISVTSDHRFHTTERGWVVSAELQIGEAIESLDGRRLVFETRSAQARKAPTFNLSVAEDHNYYFVGESGLWVHNCTPCGGGTDDLGDSDYHGPWREPPADNLKWKNYLEQETGTKAPFDMTDPHAHHVFPKRGRPGEQRRLVDEGQDILRRRGGIDPIFDTENLTWAPNRVAGQHSTSTIRGMVERLRELEAAKASPEDFAKALEDFGKTAAERK